MMMSKRLKVCETLEEALAAEAIGILLWRSQGYWVKNPYGPYVDDEDEREWVDNGWYGYYVEDDNEEVQ
jgi:hypothetical protein